MASEPTILAFDTSAAHCAAALLLGGEIVASVHEEMARGQAERLMPLLDETLAQSGTAWEALDAVAVGTGPGNFTGVRIAVATGRGLALGLGVPAIGVSAFEAMRGAEEFGQMAPQLVSIPAQRRGADIMVQFFRDGVADGPPREGTLLAETEDEMLDLSDLRDGAQILGHGAGALASAVGNATGPVVPFDFADAPGMRLCERIAHVAALKLHAGQTRPRPAPLYIRPADAAPPSDPPPKILP